MKKPPILMCSELTGRVYILTGYTQTGDVVVAKMKYDVTDQFEKIEEFRTHHSREDKQ